MKRIKKIIKSFAFILIFLVLFYAVSNILTGTRMDGEVTDYFQQIGGFYDEPADSLDAVYIGSSSVYAFWLSPIAYDKEGITVFPFASGSQPLSAVPFLIEEVKKSQPEALMIININETQGPPSSPPMHWLCDYMPQSVNRTELIEYLYKNGGGFDSPGRAQYHLPLIRYHSRWKELTGHDFHRSVDGLKGARYYDIFLTGCMDVSSGPRNVDRGGAMSEYYESSITGILDYCDAENVDVLFVIVPQYVKDEDLYAQFNAAQAYIESRGYSVLNLTGKEQDIGLDLAHDYYNEYHTNIHGALKYTDYFAEYLADHYDFPDKTGKDYDSWDEAYERYMEIISPYLTETELKKYAPKDK